MPDDDDGFPKQLIFRQKDKTIIHHITDNINPATQDEGAVVNDDESDIESVEDEGAQHESEDGEALESVEDEGAQHESEDDEAQPEIKDEGAQPETSDEGA